MFAVVLLLSAVILYSLFGLFGTSQDLSQLVNGAYQQERYSSQSRITILQLARDIRDLYIQTTGSALEPSERQSKTEEYKAKIEEDKTLLYQQLDLLDNSYDVLPVLAGEYRQAVDAWIAVGDQIVTAAAEGNQSLAAELILNDCPEALDKLTVLAKQIDGDAAQAAGEAFSHSLNSVWITCAVSGAAFVAAVLLTLLLSRSVRKSILSPLQETQRLAEELSKGNLSYPIAYQSKDEFGRLADSLRESEQILSAYVADISRAMKELSDGNFNISASQEFAGDFAEIETSITHFIRTMSDLIRQVSNFAEQVSSGTEQVAVGAQNLAQGTVEQAGSLQEIAASLDSTSEKVSSNARNAAQASQTAETATEKINGCSDKMNGLIRAMSELEQTAGKMNSVVGTIQELAFQTNLLSLNAAVEAAHAGSAGKGFAVVAGEVRELANKSSEASRNTAMLIEQSVASVKSCAEIVRDTADALFSTTDNITETAGMLSGISDACALQAELLTQVNLGIQQISVVVQNNSATAEQSAASSEELAGLAKGLREMVSHFRTKEA